MSQPTQAIPNNVTSSSESIPLRWRLRELAILFTRLGFTTFGGPAAHVAMIEDEVVARRKWLDRSHFLDIVAAINFIPGPNSTELAIHLGQLRAGLAGLLVAGVCFITPAALIILPIAWIYVKFGTLPQVEPILRAISAAIVAVVGMATIRFWRISIRDGFTGVLCALVVMGAFVVQRYTDLQPEIPALIVSAICAVAWYTRHTGTTLLGVVPAPLLLAQLPDGCFRMAVFFLKVGATLFGSGYVLVSYLQSGMVDHFQWLTQRQLLDAIAVGQFTPGPLLTTATFIGFVLGHTQFDGGIPGGAIGALVATVSIFLPSFVLVALLGPMLQKLRKNPFARSALDGMNAAVVALMLLVTLRLAHSALLKADGAAIDWMSVLVLAAAVLALLWKCNAAWIVLGAGVCGWLTGT